MKIAFITDDGETISSHFGRAKHYKIFTVDEKEIVHEELIDKPYHTDEHHSHDHDHHHGTGHSPGKFKPIADCDVLVCGGMGEPAYQRAQQKGHQVYLTGGKIKTALDSLLNDELQSDLRRVHKH